MTVWLVRATHPGAPADQQHGHKIGFERPYSWCLHKLRQTGRTLQYSFTKSDSCYKPRLLSTNIKLPKILGSEPRKVCVYDQMCAALAKTRVRKASVLQPRQEVFGIRFLFNLFKSKICFAIISSTEWDLRWWLRRPRFEFVNSAGQVVWWKS